MRYGLILAALLAGIAAGPPQDFTSLNGALPPPKPGEQRIVFIGDSITSGWGVSDPGFFTNGRIGRGIRSQTTAQIRARFAADVLALHPAIVHILAGTNDISGNGGPMTLDETEANLAAMAADAKAAGVVVILASVLPAADFPWRPGQSPQASLKALCVWEQREAAAKGYVYADYYPLFDDGKGGMKAELTKDGVHPNVDGYRVLEKVAEAAIARARTLAH